MQQLSIRRALNLIRYIDIFGAPITFNIDGRSNYKSIFGGLMTSLTLIFVSIILFPTFISFINKDQVIVQITSFFQSTPPKVVLNDQTFMFFTSISQPQQYPYNENPFFIIEMIYTIKNKSGTFKNNVELIPCKDRSFSAQIMTTLAPIYDQKNLSQFLCPPQNYFMELQGAYLSNEFKYVKFDVKNCINQTNLTSKNQTWKYTCPPDNDVYNFFNQQGSLTFQFYSLNFVINPDKPSGYVQQYLSEDLHFQFQPTISYTNVNVFLGEYDIQTDNSLFIDVDHHTERFVVRDEAQTKLETTFEFRSNNLMTKQSDISAISMFIRSSNLSTKVRRSFRKFDFLVSYFGGFMQIFLVVCGIFLRYYNRQYFMLRLANKIYDFKENREQILNSLSDKRVYQLNQILLKSQEKTKTKKLRHYTTLNETAINDEVEKVKSIGFRDKTELLDIYYKYFVKGTQDFRPGVKYFLYIISCGKLFGSEHNRLIDEAIKRAEKDINLKNIMQNISSNKFRLKKMTKWLFDPEQRTLLNYNPKQRLSLQSQYIKSQERAKPLRSDTINQKDQQRSFYMIRSSIRQKTNDKIQIKRSDVSTYLKFDHFVSSFEQLLSTRDLIKNSILMKKELVFVLLAAISLEKEQNNQQNSSFKASQSSPHNTFQDQEAILDNSDAKIIVDDSVRGPQSHHDIQER